MEAAIKEEGKKSGIIVYAVIVIMTISLFGCFPPKHKPTYKPTYEPKCEPYVPPYVENKKVIDGIFFRSLFGAMVEKAFACYVLGYSDVIVAQKLKNDFQSIYFSFSRGHMQEMMLIQGSSCSEARRAARSTDSEKDFQNFALSAMVHAQRQMVDLPMETFSPENKEFEKFNAKRLLDQTAEEAIKASEQRFQVKEIFTILDGFSREEREQYFKKTIELRMAGATYKEMIEYLKSQKPKKEEDKK